MKDTLDLWGGGDDVDVVCDVERAFGIKLTGDEAERTRTVGELYDLIEMKYPNAGRGTPACLSQIAFYRLRRALKAMGATGKITPQTPVSVLDGLEPPSISQKWRRLAQTSGLDLPPLETRFRMFQTYLAIFPLLPHFLWGVLVFALGAVACFLRIRQVVLLSGLVGISVLCPAIDYVWWLVFRTVPRRLRTVGDLAREAAGCSFTKLTAEKSGCGPSDRWFALIAILRAISGHQVAITRATTFFAIHAKSAG
jgi:hypothetical protein